MEKRKIRTRMHTHARTIPHSSMEYFSQNDIELPREKGFAIIDGHTYIAKQMQIFQKFRFPIVRFDLL